MKRRRRTPGRRGHGVQQVREVQIAARLAPVVHGLAQELDLLEAVVEEVAHLGEHLGQGAAALRPARLRDDAEGAVLVAPLDDGDHPLVLAVPRDRVDVVLPVLREAGGHDPLAAPAPRHDLGELAHARRAQDEVEIRHALQGPLPFLLGHAAAEADEQIRVAPLEEAVFAQARVDLLLGLVADAARVEEDDVRPVGLMGGEDALLHELAGHALAVQLVHLASPGLDVEPARRPGFGAIMRRPLLSAAMAGASVRRSGAPRHRRCPARSSVSPRPAAPALRLRGAIPAARPPAAPPPGNRRAPCGSSRPRSGSLRSCARTRSHSGLILPSRK